MSMQVSSVARNLTVDDNVKFFYVRYYHKL